MYIFKSKILKKLLWGGTTHPWNKTEVGRGHRSHT